MYRSPLTYQCQKAVLHYLNVVKRKNLAKNCKSLRKINRTVAYHLKKVTVEFGFESRTGSVWFIDIDGMEVEYKEIMESDDDESGNCQLFPMTVLSSMWSFYLDRGGTTVVDFHIDNPFFYWEFLVPDSIKFNVKRLKITSKYFYKNKMLERLKNMQIERMELVYPLEHEADLLFEDLQNVAPMELSIETVLIQKEQLLKLISKNLKSKLLIQSIETNISTFEIFEQVRALFTEHPVLNSFHSAPYDSSNLEHFQVPNDKEMLYVNGRACITLQTSSPDLELNIYNEQGRTTMKVMPRGSATSVFNLITRIGPERLTHTLLAYTRLLRADYQGNAHFFTSTVLLWSLWCVASHEYNLVKRSVWNNDRNVIVRWIETMVWFVVITWNWLFVFSVCEQWVVAYLL